jgi:hypothetical protein
MTENVKHVESKFADWLASQMPPNTVISDAGWWAPRILREIERLQREAAGDGEGDWTALDRVYNFLMGIADLDGVSFGEDHPKVAPGRYWWRHDLAAAYVAARKSPRPTGTDYLGFAIKEASMPDGVAAIVTQNGKAVAAITTPASAEPGYDLESIIDSMEHDASDIRLGRQWMSACEHYAKRLRSIPTDARGGGEAVCSTHPDAPHGFNRNASHNEDRYVCDCEGWTPPTSHPTPAALDAESGHG